MAGWVRFFLVIANLFSFCAYAKESSPGFVVLSPPKCGTYLIAKILASVTGQEPALYLGELGIQEGVDIVRQETEKGRFVVAHNFHPLTLKRLVKRGYRVIFLVRDPRDQLISVMNWFREGQWSWIPASKISNVDEQISEMITGAKLGWRCYDGCFGRYYSVAKTIPSNHLFTTRFEALVGPQGGGDEERQINEILNLAAFLQVPLSNDEAVFIAERAWGVKGTFRQGKIGSWKQYFSLQHQQAYQQLYTPILIELGYDSW